MIVHDEHETVIVYNPYDAARMRDEDRQAMFDDLAGQLTPPPVAARLDRPSRSYACPRGMIT